MGDAGEMTVPKLSFQSRDLEDLLNIIDRMRSQGVGRYVDIPQIIVCGDQSSGKSSCLEAICGIKFPVGDSLCTRFATEFILRRSTDEGVTVTIMPDTSRPEKEQKLLEEFQPPTTDLNDFDLVTKAAASLMGIDQNSKTFSNDVLRIEISGPTQPHLTLVDLPGVFHAATKRQTESDREAVSNLVQSYMKKTRSIILAVVSAKSDINNQIVTKMAREIDRDGRRTLGIITKPDTLHKGSESEKEFYALAQNKEVKFALGWHVVKNRDFDTRDSPNQERDAAEADFFSRGLWNSLPKKEVGVQSLRSRLSHVLRDQILAELPGFIADVEAGIADCNSRIAHLGVSRGSLKEQKSYLYRVADDFSNLVKGAVNGNYDDRFFGDPRSDEGFSKRLRAVQQSLLEAYAETMGKKGQKWLVLEEDSERAKRLREEGKDRPKTIPQPIPRDDYLSEVSQMIKRGRGIELRGTYRPEIIGELFRDQCSPWKNITVNIMEEIFSAAQTTLVLALESCTDQTTNDGIMRYIINPTLDLISNDLDSKVDLLLNQHLRGHPITFNHYFTENIQRLRNEHKAKHTARKLEQFFGKDPTGDDNFMDRHSFSTKTLLEALCQDTEADMDKFACSEAHYFMAAYYKVALKQHVDDVAIHAIEACLMQKLADIFTPKTVLDMDDEVIDDIASETDESKLERTSSTKKLEILEAALQALRRLDKHKPKGADKPAYSLPEPKLTEPVQISPSVASPPAPVSSEPRLGYPTGSMSREEFDRQMRSRFQAAIPLFDPATAELAHQYLAAQRRLDEVGGLRAGGWEGLVASLEIMRISFLHMRPSHRQRGTNVEQELTDCESMLQRARARAGNLKESQSDCVRLGRHQRELFLQAGPSEEAKAALMFMAQNPRQC